jgi:NADPH:quinone reductase-like Zn-dependent oxidoreductase
MHAIIYRRYGSPGVLKLEEVEKPIPSDQEVLIQVRAASVNPLDWHFLRGTPYPLRIMTGLLRPKFSRLGVDVAGLVDAVGRSVTQLKPGDEVFGMARGAFAEYACAPERTLAIKPAGVTFEQAASIPVAGITALQGLRGIDESGSGKRVLINGASGGVGTFAVQIAKSFGAQVTGVCRTRNVEMVRSLGADRVVDYTQEDFTRGGDRYDLMLDCIGNRSLSACRRALNPKGKCLMVGGPSGRWIAPLDRMIKAMMVSPFVSPKMGILMIKPSREDLIILRDLVQARKMTPFVDRRYALSEVPSAIQHVEEGHARGKLVIRVE